MKKAKKIMAFLLATLMVMGMSMSVFAANEKPHTITIKNETTGYTYDAYQVFAGDYTEEAGEEKLSNIEWGKNVDGNGIINTLTTETIETKPNPNYDAAFAGCSSAEDVAGVLAGKDNDSDIAKKFANAVEKNIKNDVDPAGTATECVNEEYAIPVKGDGYYFVKNRTVPNEDSSYTRYLLLVVGDATAEHKGTYPTVDKVIDDDGDKKVNEASIGDSVSYKITGRMPENIGDYNTYYYVFTDTLSEGLTYNDNVRVMIGQNDVTEYFYRTKTDLGENGTKITVGMKDLLELKNLNPSIDITKETIVEITYTATLNDKAVVAGDGNSNNVTLKYSNNPNESGEGSTSQPPQPNPEDPVPDPDPEIPTGETPTSEVKTYVTEITIKKVDGEGEKLEGAAFRITGTGVKTIVTTGIVFVEADEQEGTHYKLKDGTYTTEAPNGDAEHDAAYESTTQKYKQTDKTTIETVPDTVYAEGFVDAEGILTFTGLGAGEYTITEIVTPEGYNTAENITFTLTFEADTKTFTSSNPNVSIGDSDNKFDVTIQNNAGSTLPSTGGMGTTIFYIVGGVLVLVAVVLLVTKKRMKED